jgi:hypothetical protein
MTASISFRTTLVLPTVSRLQEALIGFFRSSEYGPWKLDETRGERCIRFVRGNWQEEAGESGRAVARVAGFPRWAPQHGYMANTIPMRLQVDLHIEPEQVTVNLEHTAYARENPDDIRATCESWVRSEVKSLVKCLRVGFNLPNAPEVAYLNDPAVVLATS